MGIKSLSDIYTEGSVGTIKMDRFRGHRIAFDVGTWIYASWSSACRNVVETTYLLTDTVDEGDVFKEWLKLTLRTVEGFLSRGITPVFIFDGIAPEDKNKTQGARREALERSRERYREFISSIEGMDPLLLNSTVLDEMRKLYLGARLIRIPDFALIMSILQSLGLPSLKAIGEAERLCSALCREGWVAAVFSSDTDNLVHGCPLLLKSIKYDSFDYVHLSSLLVGLEMNRETFVDFCICSGCDYNDNMKRIGIKRSLALLKEYRTLEALPSKYDRSCLREERCRELFSLVPSSTLAECEINEEILTVRGESIMDGRDLLEVYSVEGFIPILIPLYRQLPKPYRLTYHLNPNLPKFNIL